MLAALCVSLRNCGNSRPLRAWACHPAGTSREAELRGRCGPKQSQGPRRRISRQIPGKGIAYSTTAANAIATNTTVQAIHARDLCCGTWLMRAIVSRPQPDSERTSYIHHGSDFLAAKTTAGGGCRLAAALCPSPAAPLSRKGRAVQVGTVLEFVRSDADWPPPRPFAARRCGRPFRPHWSASRRAR